MTSYLGRRVYAQIWKSASPLLAGSPRRIPHRSSPAESWTSKSTTQPPGFTRGFSFRLPLRPSRRAVSKSFASGGLFAASLNSTSVVKDAAIITCSNAAEKGLCSGPKLADSQMIISPASFIWKKGIHNSTKKRITGNKRNKSSASNGRNARKNGQDTVQSAAPSSPLKGTKPRDSAIPAQDAVVSSANKTFLDRLPHMPQIHRPSKEELLAAATGFWSRLKIRFKWFSIRSMRPFNTDDISAFFSWFLLGHVIWILVGTTTFFSLGIFALNTVFAQETIARWIGNYLTKSSGIKVVFESAIVPKWGDGVISFKNVFVTRRPGQGKSKVKKGSSITAAAAAAAAARKEELGEARDPVATADEEEEDTNYTQFDLTIGTVNVTLSFAKWFNGKGLLRDVEVYGIRGVVDRTSVHYTGEYVDPRTYKHEHNPGDFEIDSFRLEDLLVTVHQPRGFRPFSVSIYSCELPKLRKQWLFYDLLSANTISGSFDDSLFTIHPRQSHSLANGQINTILEATGEPSLWKKQSRLRIDALNIDHLNRGVQGPFSWIREGNVDIVADVLFPADNDESIAKVMSDFYSQMEATITQSRYLDPGREHNNIHSDAASEPSKQAKQKREDDRFLIMDLRLHLNDVRAGVPIFTRELSYVNNALIRPIVAYINSRHTFIPINCRVVKRASEFDGSWTIFDSGLMDDLSAEVCHFL